MNEFEYKFSLWQFDVVTDFNRTTQLVRNRSTGRLMVKKIMPAYEFEVHNAVSKINNCHIAKVFDVITNRNAALFLKNMYKVIPLSSICQKVLLRKIMP